MFTPLEGYDVVVTPLAGKSFGEEIRVNPVTWATVNRLDPRFGSEVLNILGIDVPNERVDRLLVSGLFPSPFGVGSLFGDSFLVVAISFDSLAVRMFQSFV